MSISVKCSCIFAAVCSDRCPLVLLGSRIRSWHIFIDGDVRQQFRWIDHLGVFIEPHQLVRTGNQVNPLTVLSRFCIGFPVPGSLYLKLNTVYSQVVPGNCKLASNRLVSRTGNAIGIVAVWQVVVAVLIRFQIGILVILAGHRDDRRGILSARCFFYCKVYFIDR